MKKINDFTAIKSMVIAFVAFMIVNISYSFAQVPTNLSIEQRVSATRDMCKQYMKSFESSETNLVYRYRLDTPEGSATFETPEAAAKEQVRGGYLPYGYGAGFEDAAFLNGILLFALCEAYDATGEPYFSELAKQIFTGMKLIGTLSPVPGFIVRGPHPFDGKSYYRDSSLDQHTLYTCGLWRFYHSKIANEEQKAFIRSSLNAVATRMERNNWVLLVEDNSREARAGGGNWRDSEHLLLFMLAVVKDVTGSEHWQAEYEKYSAEKNGYRWQLLAQPSSEELPRYDFYVNQEGFRLNVLARVEKDTENKQIVFEHIKNMAEDMFNSNLFTHWHRRDWIGSRADDEQANTYLKPLGYNLTSSATIFDLWEKFEPNHHDLQLPQEEFNRRYISLTTRAPLVAWHIGILSENSELYFRIDDHIAELYNRMNPDYISDGWVWNHATVLALLDIAYYRRQLDLMKKSKL